MCAYRPPLRFRIRMYRLLSCLTGNIGRSMGDSTFVERRESHDAS